MRINGKGQVTIPIRIREKAGLLPNTEVDFIYAGYGTVHLVRTGPRGRGAGRGRRLVAHLRGRGDVNMSTEEILALMRGG
jgi:AbrB family looped-hinge helix DNA binding protein